mmetsp:Transcript_22112/g.49428  ORF Transcript_22112/g.49428 Transcript_22112/m.49428 type:complete len:83 (+) Transcript_22112:532-780(+)
MAAKNGCHIAAVLFIDGVTCLLLGNETPPKFSRFCSSVAAVTVSGRNSRLVGHFEKSHNVFYVHVHGGMQRLTMIEHIFIEG